VARDITEIRRDIEETRARLRDTAEAIGWKADVPARARDLLRETATVVRERVASGEHTRPANGGGGPSLGQRVGAVASSVTGTVGSASSSVTDTVGSATSAVSDRAGAVAEKVAAAGSAIGDKASSATASVKDTAGSASDSATGIRQSVADHLPAPADARQGVRRVAGTARANPVALAAGALAVGAVAGLLLPSTRVEDERLGPVADDVKEKGAGMAHEAIDKGREAVRSVAPDDAPVGAASS
jgi:hypothetical protein